MRLNRFLTPALLLLVPVAANAKDVDLLAPHRAVYDLKLGEANERSGVTGLTGRAVYQFEGGACEGYSTVFRFVTDVASSDSSKLTDQQTTTFEDGKGKNFRFDTKTFVDQTPNLELKGHAIEEKTGLKVLVEKPEVKELDLAAALFPTQHMIELLDKARKGETFYETNLFDGSDEANKVMSTTIVIGNKTTPKSDDAEVKAVSSLSDESYWPVDIAYFDLANITGEELPSYRISFKLHESGMTRDLLMDYGDFSIIGQLVDLEMLEHKKTNCKPN